jgi:hypothetical protein
LAVNRAVIAFAAGSEKPTTVQMLRKPYWEVVDRETAERYVRAVHDCSLFPCVSLRVPLVQKSFSWQKESISFFWPSGASG